MQAIRDAGKWVWTQPYLLLLLTMLMWSGNAVASRLAIGAISPMALTSGRWIVACLVLAPFVGRRFSEEWPTLRPSIWRVALMGVLGFTAFNAFYYEAAHHTTAVNLTILQGAIPVFVLVFAWIAYRTRVTPFQIVGAIVAISGVLVLASRGEWAVLLGLKFNIGDVWMVFASALYAIYTVALRRRPAVSGLTLFSAFAIAAALTTLPLVAFEAWQGDLFWPTPRGLAIMAYVGLFPSLVSQLFFMRAVDLIGPGRAGVFTNLVPVFGALMAVALLGEPFGLSTGLALVLVVGGILLAETLGRR